MLKRLTLYWIIILSVLGFAAFSAGFVKSLQVTVGPTPAAAGTSRQASTEAAAAAPIKDANSIRIVVMGDSIAKGTGDEKGKGFSGYLRDYLKNQTSKDLLIENLGVDGLRSDGLLDQFQNQKLKSLLAASNVVLISIGGNDLRSLRSADNTTKEAQFRGLEADYLKSLQEMITTIRKNSTSTIIVLMGLYNPYGDSASAEDVKLVSTWNYDTQKLVEADPKAVFIPTLDLFKFNLPRFIAPDGLHPNSLGYQTVSNRIAKSIEAVVN